jgi:hypothetical protein
MYLPNYKFVSIPRIPITYATEVSPASPSKYLMFVNAVYLLSPEPTTSTLIGISKMCYFTLR